MADPIDVLIIGAGAAGLMAGIWAGRTNPRCRVVILDSAAKLGAKILVAGGGRCNVTHHEVTATAYAGSSRHSIQKVLRQFEVRQTVAFFQELGVGLKREETGKLFPVSDSAKTVLAALLGAAEAAGVQIWHPRRVTAVERTESGFVVRGDWGQVVAQKVVLATGGKSLPKSGSDGTGYALAQSLGHSLTPHLWPALVPLTLASNHFIIGLSGITLPTTLELWSGSGKRLTAFTDSTLCTHFGLSGPAVLDMSRYYLAAKAEDASTSLTLNWLPGETVESLEKRLLAEPKATAVKFLRDRLPERVALALCQSVGVSPATAVGQMPREQRKAFVHQLVQMALPVTGTRGFQVAEVTAGGVPLSELHLQTLESRLCPGLYLCGEICDVDGRIGGFNFQWAWSSGYTVGISVAASLSSP